MTKSISYDLFNLYAKINRACMCEVKEWKLRLAIMSLEVHLLCDCGM